jgi:ketosteroid isomerase-like protein
VLSSLLLHERRYWLAMSEENVEIVRRAYVALTQGDVDTLRELAVPEFVFDFSRRLLDPYVIRGREEALASFVSETRRSWEGWPTWEPQELIDADDQVVVRARISARPRGSGVEVETRVWHLWTLRDRKVAEHVYFGEDRAAALEVAGIEYLADKGPQP